VRPGGSHFQPTPSPEPAFRDAGRAPHPEMKPDLAASGHGNHRFQLQTPSQRPGGPKAISYQQILQKVTLQDIWGDKYETLIY